MKKFIKKLWVFITTLQFGLSIIALLSWFQARSEERRGVRTHIYIYIYMR